MTSRVSAGLAGLVLAGCVTATTGGPARYASAGGALTVIGPDVLRAEPSQPVYDLVLRRWPNLLRPPVIGAAGGRDARGDVIGVYAATHWLGGQDALRSINAVHVQSIRRLTPSEEFARFGRAHDGGGLEIVWGGPRPYGPACSRTCSRSR